MPAGRACPPPVPDRLLEPAALAPGRAQPVQAARLGLPVTGRLGRRQRRPRRSRCSRTWSASVSGRHRACVTVHDFGFAMHNGRPYAYLVMQLLPGESLSAALKAGQLPLPTALYATACVADALDAAHEAGLTHRDIKPSNSMVRDNGEATVVDFGIAKGSDARHDITTTPGVTHSDTLVPRPLPRGCERRDLVEEPAHPVGEPARSGTAQRPPRIPDRDGGGHPGTRQVLERLTELGAPA
ncbi:phosphotransferase [Streptomyces sp. NPDC020192]|uniref:protein kinase domain-containing protein n=1 Tax=Streptomyces sp. NPDC020192 TaxID=3365066 RepID=UPI0037B09A09